MVKPGTYEEIMRRSSTQVDDFAMSLQIPLCDWSGYFLFAAIDGDGCDFVAEFHETRMYTAWLRKQDRILAHCENF